MSISAQNDDPHASGYWAVIIDKNNQEVWYKLDSDIINNPEMRTCFVVADTTLADYQNWQGNYPKIPFYYLRMITISLSMQITIIIWAYLLIPRLSNNTAMSHSV